MTDAIAQSHRDRIGCSELAAAIGVSPWKTPYQLWEEKTGRAKPPDLSGHFRVTLGNHLEAVVANLWTEHTGLKLRRRNQPFQDGFLIGHLDREVVGKREVWEGKTALGQFRSEEWGEAGTDQIPVAYLCQVLGYLGITGYDRAHVAALLAGPELRTYTIERDENAIRMVMDGAHEFWQYVLDDTPPPVTTLTDAQRRWGRSVESAVIAYADDLERVAEWRRLAQEAKRIDNKITAIKLRMAERLQENDTLTDPAGNKLMTWKTQSAPHLDAKRIKAEVPDIYESYAQTFTSRVFRLAKEKTQ